MNPIVPLLSRPALPSIPTTTLTGRSNPLSPGGGQDLAPSSLLRHTSYWWASSVPCAAALSCWRVRSVPCVAAPRLLPTPDELLVPIVVLRQPAPGDAVHAF